MSVDRTHSVLLVEDEMLVAADLQQTLRDMGYDAFAIAETADEALKCATERCPDIVLMDLRIRGRRDGIETATLLRHKFGVPIIFLAAHADDATLERAKVAEPYAYLMKPVRAAELRSAIEMALYRHKVERRLRARERWFSTTLRSIADAVVTVDLAGRVTFMNPAAAQLTGVAIGDALGRPVHEIVRLLDPNQPSSPLDTVLAEGHPIVIPEAPLEQPAATDRIISDSASPVMDGGKMLGAVMVFRDVTEQKAMQRQLELADRLASLGTMAAGVAHEVNNPLSVVVANAAFIAEELATLAGSGEPARVVGDVVEAVRELGSAAGRIAQIVGDLQAFSRPAQPAAGEADVDSAIAWAVRATAGELKTRASVQTRLGSRRWVKLDETRLGQTLVNLLINAAHAIPPGRYQDNSVTVTTRDEGSNVVIEVRDTGTGMSPEVLERIFEPFFTTKAAGVGTGLGLAICRGLVTSAGGTLGVESSPGVGTSFRISLPSTARPEVQIERVLDAGIVHRGRVLVVDDDRMILKAIARLLRGHEVVCVEDARQALGMVEAGEAFDLILSDMMMPRMTGVEFYEALLAKHPDVASRIVFLTGGEVVPRTVDFLAVVPNAQLRKPLDVQTLRAVLAAMIARRKDTPAAA